MPFRVIVGAWIAGLGAAIVLTDKGHHVTVLEATSKLQAIGGLIVIQANANRVLDSLGLYQSLLTVCGTEPLLVGTRRYSNGEWLRKRPGTAYHKEFGYPYVESFLPLSVKLYPNVGFGPDFVSNGSKIESH